MKKQYSVWSIKLNEAEIDHVQRVNPSNDYFTKELCDIFTIDWIPYPGEYIKSEYDIRLKNGEEHHNCWPNAGKFCLLLGKGKNKGKMIPEDQVAYVRRAKVHSLERLEKMPV